MFFLPLLGLGIKAVSGFAQANRAEATGTLNHAINVSNATIRRQNTLAGIRTDQLRSRLQLDTARVNFRLARADAEAQGRRADRLRDFAERQTKQGRESVRRMRRRFDQLEGEQMASIASSGVTASGSALDVLTDSAEQMALSIADAWDDVTSRVDETHQQAALIDFDADQTRISAKSNLLANRRAHRINKASARLARISAHSEFRSALFGADVSRMNARSNANGQRLSTVGGVVSGAANIGYQHSQYQRYSA